MTLANGPQAYLKRLDKALKGLPRDERTRILDEIGGHLDERAKTGGYDAAAVALGDPMVLARPFIEDYEAARARTRPAGLARAAAVAVALGRLLAISAAWLMAAMFGAVGMVMVVAGLVKPFHPNHIGLFSLEKGATFTVTLGDDSPAPGHDVFGLWFILVAFVMAAVLWSLAAILVRLIGLQLGFGLRELQRLFGRSSHAA